MNHDQGKGFVEELSPAASRNVFDLKLPLDEAAEGYKAMDERRALMLLLRV